MKKLLFALVIILIVTGITLAQKFVTCKYPIHVSADSLFSYTLKQNNKKASDVENLNDHFNYKIASKLDSVYALSQDYLIDKLGMDNYCRYATLSVDGFHYRDYSNNGMEDCRLDYMIELPGLNGKGSAGQMKIQFIFIVKPGKPTSIQHDRELPECRELFKKGFGIDKEKAIEIAKKNDFIYEGDHYKIELIVFDWVITKFIQARAQNHEVRISAITGVQSETKIIPLVY